MSNNDKCKYCGCEDLCYDFVVDEFDSIHDTIDCPKCGARLFYEE